eukprot:PhM_4_TR6991/c0_g1_i1/m.44265/K11094/SNRPB2; U2 small nuclear ribonucleoprotein B''
MSHLVPSQTLYVHGLPDKESKEEIKRNLYAMFSQHGKILDINARKTPSTRGQAFIVYSDISNATTAARALDGTSFLGRTMRIQFAKQTSHVVQMGKGTLEHPAAVAEKQKEQASKKKSKSVVVKKRTAAESDDANNDNNNNSSNVPVQVVASVPSSQSSQAVFGGFDGLLRARAQPTRVHGGGDAVVVIADFDSVSSAKAAISKLKAQGIQAAQR